MTVVGRSIVRRPPVIAAQVIEPGWLFGERNFGAHLERGRAAAPEDAFEADMPDHAFGAHETWPTLDGGCGQAFCG